MAKSADRDTVIAIMESLPKLPENAERLLSFFREKVTQHNEMYAKNRRLWREKYYEYLPYRQCKKFVERNITNRVHFKSLLESISVKKANATIDWGMKEFFQASLASKCICNRHKKSESAEQQRARLEVNLPKIKEGEEDLLQGRTPLDIRQFVTNASLYRMMKLVTKWKNYTEPAFDLLFNTGKHLYSLISSSVPESGRRAQNVFSFPLVITCVGLVLDSHSVSKSNAERHRKM